MLPEGSSSDDRCDVVRDDALVDAVIALTQVVQRQLAVVLGGALARQRLTVNLYWKKILI